MDERPPFHAGRPTVKVRVDAIGHGSITIDDGPELPVRHLRIESGVRQATVVSFDLIAVNVDAELPVDIIESDGLSVEELRVETGT